MFFSATFTQKRRTMPEASSEVLGRIQHHVAPGAENLLQQGGQLRLQLLQVCLIGDGDIADRPGVVIGTVEDILHLRVVDDLHIAAAVGDGGGADSDLGDHAPETVDLHDVAHVVLVLQQHEGADDHVSDETLGAEADHQGQHADAGDDGAHVNAQQGQTLADDDDAGHIFDQAAQQRQHRPAAVGAGLDTVQNEDDQVGHQQHQQDHDSQLQQGGELQRKNSLQLREVNDVGEIAQGHHRRQKQQVDKHTHR